VNCYTTKVIIKNQLHFFICLCFIQRNQCKEGNRVHIGSNRNIYNKQSNFEKQWNIIRKDSKAKELNDKQSICNTIGNIGIVYRATGKLDKAMESYQEQLRIAEESETTLE
jgi:tetratricopeptide (TPR) repeat protein